MDIKEFVRVIKNLQSSMQVTRSSCGDIIVKKNGIVLFTVIHTTVAFIFEHHFGKERESIMERHDKRGDRYEFSCTLKFERKNKSLVPRLRYGTDIDVASFRFLLHVVANRLQTTQDVGLLYEDVSLYLGCGAYGTVWKSSSANSALKILNKEEENIRYFMIEISILQKLDHPNVVKYLSKGKFYGLPFYEMELGTKELQDLEDQDIPESIFGDISKAVAYLHSRNVLHGDITIRNVLVFESDNGYMAKLADFGASIELKTKVWSSYRFTTRKFEPPGFRENESYVFAFEYDVWSMGCVFFWALTKKFFKGEPPPEVHPSRISEATWKCFLSETSASIANFLTGEIYSEPSIDHSQVTHLDARFVEFYREMGIHRNTFF